MYSAGLCYFLLGAFCFERLGVGYEDAETIALEGDVSFDLVGVGVDDAHVLVV